jgi:drug/metabolite transporter (DMT)-like permease
MDALAVALLGAVLILETGSHLALKSASLRAGEKSGVRYLLRIAIQPPFFFALVCFVLGFLAWLAFLSRVPLGQGVMAGSLTIVGVMVGGRLMYGERLSRARIVAVMLIATGVALVGWG